MKRSSFYSVTLATLLSLSLLMSACSTSTNSNAIGGASTASDPVVASTSAEGRTLKDGLGNDVKLPANPQRVIASYLEDHLVALGVKPVAQWSVSNGKSVQNYLQKELQGIPTIPHDLPFEVVMSFAPDLIILDSSELAAGDKYAQYSKIAPTFTVGGAINNDWRQELLTIGEILNKGGEARKVLDSYDSKVKQAKGQLSPVIGDKAVAVLWVTAKSVYVPNEKLSSGDVLYKDLGLKAPQAIKEISETGTANWNPISLEKLAEMKVDYLFIVNSKGVTKDELLKDPVWAGVPAVKDGHVYTFDNNSSWLYTGAIANSQMIDHVIESVLKK